MTTWILLTLCHLGSVCPGREKTDLKANPGVAICNYSHQFHKSYKSYPSLVISTPSKKNNYLECLQLHLGPQKDSRWEILLLIS